VPVASNGVSNNLYLGAANLNNLGNSPVKKKSPREAYTQATHPEEAPEEEDDAEEANKNTITINKQTIGGARRNEQSRAEANGANNNGLHEQFEYSSGGKNKTKSSFNSKT
jgi:hypothetical protein